LELPEAADVEAWLQLERRQVVPRFPGSFESIYTRETRARRLRALQLSTLTGCIFGLFFAASAWPVLTDAHAAISHTWLGAAVPVGILCNLLQLSTRLSLRAQEWQSAGCALFIGGCLALILSHSSHAPSGYLVGGTIMLMMLDCAAAGLSMLPSVFLVLGLEGTFSAAISYMAGEHQVDAMATLTMMLLMIACGLYILFGNWRLETEVRRSYALAMRERIERRELSLRNQELDRLLGNDPLTGVASRRAFDEQLEASWSRAAAAGGSVSLIIFDVDAFKAYNDTYGHPAGDTCLRAVASCLKTDLPFPVDMVARLGGEEFGVLLSSVAPNDAFYAAENLRKAVQSIRIAHTGSAKGYVTVSAGVATLAAAPTEPPVALLQAADKALYIAKRGGRNQVSAAA
jgi:diguanylate cyclase (GGDEF)-like protein